MRKATAIINVGMAEFAQQDLCQNAMLQLPAVVDDELADAEVLSEKWQPLIFVVHTYSFHEVHNVVG